MLEYNLNKHILTVKETTYSFIKTKIHYTEYDLLKWVKTGYDKLIDGEPFKNEPFFNVTESSEKWVRKWYFPKVGLNYDDYPRKQIDKRD